MKPRGNINNLAFQGGQCETARRVLSIWTTIVKPQTHLCCLDLENALHKACLHPRRRDGGVHDGRGHRATPPDLEKTPRIHVCLSLCRRTGRNKTSRSGKLYATCRVKKARSLQDRSTCRIVRRPRTTNEFTLFLMLKLLTVGPRQNETG